MATQPDFLSKAFCVDGVKQYPIPDTSTVGSGRASLTSGFPDETSQPIDDGGIPPQRKDFNGILYMLSSFAMFQQSGGKFTWDARVNYDVPSIIYYNGELWWCVSASGPGVAGVGAKTPNEQNISYWKKAKDLFYKPLDAYPVGSYYISSDATSPATLFGGTWARVQDRMILAAGTTYKTIGSTGGSATKTLTIANMPNHGHTCETNGEHAHTVNKNGEHSHTINQNGEHTHTVNKNGNHYHGAMGENYNQSLYGFYDSNRTHIGLKGDLDNDNTIWKTSTDGEHAHTVNKNGEHTHTMTKNGEHTHTVNKNGTHAHTIGKAGSGTAFDVMPPYIVAYVWRRTA